MPKVVIDIPDYLYKSIVEDEFYTPLDISQAIKNGTVLPEHQAESKQGKTLEKKIAYLELCKDEARSKDWADGIEFALTIIQDDEWAGKER